MTQENWKKSGETKAERLLQRMLEGMGASLDRRMGRDVPELPSGNLSSQALIERMKRLIDERALDRGREGKYAPHLLRLKVEWGTHSEAPPEKLKELEHEILAAAIDHINDNRYRTLAPVELQIIVDIFTTGVTVDPTFGELAAQLEEAKLTKSGHIQIPKPAAEPAGTRVNARINYPEGPTTMTLTLKPGGRRLSVGRASDADVSLPHASVSKIHAALVMNREGTLLVADTGSTNGTYINGRRIAYGEARHIEDGDVVSFGDVEVRFKKADD
ncbi:MAG: FHA domain-containing protein [Pyrinomonadaceae bacterium]